jgi:glycosyltransferase involved in cell wall biosynthesis
MLSCPSSYLVETDQKFQLIVADDGPEEETQEVVSAYGIQVQFPVEHVSQEDHGFQAATIRDRVLPATEADYVILNISFNNCVHVLHFLKQRPHG